MAEAEYYDEDTGERISDSDLSNYESAESAATTGPEDFDFYDADTGKKISADQLDSYDMTDGSSDIAEINPPSPSNEPGWWDTFTTSIGTGLAKMEGGVGALIDATPGFDVGLGDYIRADAEPYIQGGAEFRSRIPKDSWKNTFANATEGVAGTLPLLPFGGGIPGQVVLQGANTYGQTENELERQGVDPETAGDTALIDAAIQTPFNAIGMAPVFNKALGPLRKTVESGVVNAALGVPSAMGSLYSRYLGGATPEAPTWEELKEVGKEGAITGGATGAAMGLTQSGIERFSDYRSDQAMINKAHELEGKIDAQEAAKVMAKAQEAVDVVPNTVGQSVPRRDTQIIEDTYGRAPTEFDKGAAENFANQQALTKKGVTDEIPDSAKPTPPPAPELPASKEAQLPKLDGRDPVRIPLKDLKLSPDVPQFKQGANQNGVVEGEELGPYNPQNPNPIVVWERLSGQMEIITGRHRFDSAKNTEGVKDMLAYVMREADGFDMQQAQTLDAEQNIRDGNGKVQDYARYFRRAQLTEQDIIDRGMPFNRKAVKDGFTIGTKATQELFDLYWNGKIKDSDLVTAIANLAPGDVQKQMLGAKLALAGESADHIKNSIKDVELGNQESLAGEQVDMFGNRDRAINQAVEKSQLAKRKVAEYNYEIDSAVNSANRPELAKQLGVDVKDPAAVKAKIKELRAERNRWANWADYPDLRQELKRLTSPVETIKEPIEVAQKMLEPVKEESSNDDTTYYHGTTRDFKDFGVSKGGDFVGYYFTSDPKSASDWAGWHNQQPNGVDVPGKNVRPVKLKMNKTASKEELRSFEKAIKEKTGLFPTREETTNYFKSQGYDSYKDPDVWNEVVVFDPSQIKSVFEAPLLDNSGSVFPEGIEKPYVKPEVQANPKTKTTNIKESNNIDSVAKPKSTVQRLKSEKGAIVIPDIPNPFTTNGFKDLVSRLKKEGYQKNPEYYTFFSNKAGNAIASQLTKADKFPWFRRSHESSLKHFETENSISWDHAENVRPFTLLNPKEKLEASAFMYEATRRGPTFDASAQNMKVLGMSDRVIRGVQAVQKTLDNALTMLKDEAKLTLDSSGLPDDIKAQKLLDLEKSFSAMKVSNFVPTGRYGKYGLVLRNKAGEMTDFIMSDSKVKLLKTLYREKRTNPDLDEVTSIVRPVAKPLGSEYIGIHPDIVSLLGDENSHIPSVNFLNRLKKRKLIEGFDPDLARNLSSYLSSHARYISSQRTKREYQQHNKKFESFYAKLGSREKILYTGLRNDIQKLQTYVMTPSGSLNAFSEFLAKFYLANNVKTAIVNMSSFVTTYPNAARYMNAGDNSKFGPEVAFAKATRDAARSYIGKTKPGGVVGKDFFASLEQARKEGVVGGSRVIKDMLKSAARPTPTGKLSQLTSKLSDQDNLFLLNSITEDWVRAHSYAMGWHTYEKAAPFFKKRGIPMPDRHSFAKRFVRETQADYTKAGRPNIGRETGPLGGLGKVASVFRLYGHSFFTMLKKSTMEANFGAASRFVGVMGALGGVYAIPFVSTMLKSAKLAGFDPDKKIEEGAEKIGEGLDFIDSNLPLVLQTGLGKYFQSDKGKRSAKYGPLTDLLGVNVSGALNPEMVQMNPGTKDPLGFAARAALGVAADPIDRIDKFFYFLNEKGNFGRALEQVIPRAFNIGEVLSAQRIKREGLTDAGNKPLLDRPATTGELIKKSLGFMPSTWSSAYDKRQEENKVIAKNNDNENIIEKMASEKVFGTEEGYQKLLEEAKEKGYIKDPSIFVAALVKQIKRMKSPKYDQYVRMGKKGMPEANRINEKYNPLLEP